MLAFIKYKIKKYCFKKIFIIKKIQIQQYTIYIAFNILILKKKYIIIQEL